MGITVSGILGIGQKVKWLGRVPGSQSWSTEAVRWCNDVVPVTNGVTSSGYLPSGRCCHCGLTWSWCYWILASDPDPTVCSCLSINVWEIDKRCSSNTISTIAYFVQRAFWSSRTISWAVTPEVRLACNYDPISVSRRSSSLVMSEQGRGEEAENQKKNMRKNKEAKKKQMSEQIIILAVYKLSMCRIYDRKV